MPSGISSLLATQTPTPDVVPISDGSGKLNDWVDIPSADIQALLDSIGSQHGDILFRGTSDWQVLVAGSAGQKLMTNGSGADPAWVSDGTGSTGTKTIGWFLPRDNMPPASNFATLSTRTTGSTIVDTLNFSNSVQQEGYFAGVVPESASLAIGLACSIWFGAVSLTTGNVTWDIAFSRIPSGSAPSAYSTAQAFAATAVAGTLTMEVKVSVNVAIADLPSGLSAGDRYIARIRRSAAGLAEAAQFTTLEIETQ